MPKYRLILQAEGVQEDGRWFGAFAAREVAAEDEQDAIHRAEFGFRKAWQQELTPGRLEVLESIAVWRAPTLSFQRVPSGGHTLYDDDADAQEEALRLEAQVSGLPRRRLRALLADLG